MKVAILGDTHIGVRGDSATFHNYFEKFYSNVFFPYLKKHNIDTVFQVGDMFDKKKNVNFFSLSRSREYLFDKAEKNGINIICNVGNHDTFFRNNNSISAPDLLLRDYNNVNVIDEPVERDVDGTRFLILPWICRDNEAVTLDLIKKTKAQIVIGHLELTGFAMYKGVIKDHGMDPSLFNKFDTVITGHYHHKSSIGNIHYVGTPYEITWSDYDDERGFHIFDTDTRELTFIRNPYVMFNKIMYDDTGKTLEEIIDFDYDEYKDTFVRVVIGNKTNIPAFEIFVKNLEKAGAVEVKVTDNTLDIELNSEAIEEGVENTLDILKEVVDEIETTVDKDALSELLVDLFVEATQMEHV